MFPKNSGFSPQIISSILIVGFPIIFTKPILGGKIPLCFWDQPPSGGGRKLPRCCDPQNNPSQETEINAKPEKTPKLIKVSKGIILLADFFPNIWDIFGIYIYIYMYQQERFSHVKAGLSS